MPCSRPRSAVSTAPQRGALCQPVFRLGPVFPGQARFRVGAGPAGLAARRDRGASCTSSCSVRWPNCSACPTRASSRPPWLAADERLIDTFGHLGRRGAIAAARAATAAAPGLRPGGRRTAPARAGGGRALCLRRRRVAARGRCRRRRRCASMPRARRRASSACCRARRASDRRRGCSCAARSHAHCDDAVHPALRFGGPHGVWRWRGHETRAVNWPVATRAQAAPAAGAGQRHRGRDRARICVLELQVCGLRDEGEAIGSAGHPGLGAGRRRNGGWRCSARPHRRERGEQRPARGAPRGVTRCRLECDGRPHDVAPLRGRFRAGAGPAAAAGAADPAGGLVRGADGLTRAAAGRPAGAARRPAAFTWGWQLGAQGLDGRAFMRAAGRARDAGLPGRAAVRGRTRAGGVPQPHRAALRGERAAAPALAARGGRAAAAAGDAAARRSVSGCRSRPRCCRWPATAARCCRPPGPAAAPSSARPGCAPARRAAAASSGSPRCGWSR